MSEIKTQVRTAEDAVTVAEAEVARLNARLVERENGEGVWWTWRDQAQHFIYEQHSAFPEEMMTWWNSHTPWTSLEQRLEYMKRFEAVIATNRDVWMKKRVEKRFAKRRKTDVMLWGSVDGIRDLMRKALGHCGSGATNEEKVTGDLAALAALDRLATLFSAGVFLDTEHSDKEAMPWWVFTYATVESEMVASVPMLHEVLKNLMRHRSTELLAVIDKFPPEAARAMMRLTIALPTEKKS
ncbi:MAG: hypothetical protein AAB663_01975 [Patescibacteria group bacterium]